jgi:hypothetical protein
VGLTIIDGMIEAHWAGLTPPRERARVAALEWFVGRLAPAMEALTPGPADAAPLEAANHFAGLRVGREVVGDDELAWVLSVSVEAVETCPKVQRSVITEDEHWDGLGHGYILPRRLGV